MTEGDVALVRRVVPQPTPEIVPGGDCGACVLAGILGISPREAYDLKGDVKAFSHGEMRRTLRCAGSSGLADRYVEEPPIWLPRFGTGEGYEWGMPSTMFAMPWFAYVRMALDAGYYGIAQVDTLRAGGKTQGGTDHWVMVCGARLKWVDDPPPLRGQSAHADILVSCSARSSGMRDEWVPVIDFLGQRGGFNMIFARPGVRS